MSKLRVVIGLLAAWVAFAQPATIDQPAIVTMAKEELAATNTPGAAIGIVLDNKLVWAFGVGIANVETGEPVKPEMLFRLGSTTKMMTATAVAILAASGRVRFSDPVGKHVSGLDPAIAALTINQLLSHTSGLKDDAVMNGRHDDAALRDEIRLWKADWLFTTPGAIYSYSNPGYWLAGLVAETVTGKPYADAMEELVFRPVGMTSTTLRPTMAMTRPLAQGHDLVDRKVAVLRPAPDNTANWPAGSVFSNLEDLSKLTMALMNARVPQAVVTALTTPHADIPGSKAKYGYGLDVEDRRGVKYWSHGGSRSGYGSFIGMLPERHAAVIVLTNRTGQDLPRTRARILTMLSAGPDPVSEPYRPRAVPPAVQSLSVGEYRNGASVITVTRRDGNLYVGDAEAMLRFDSWLHLTGGPDVFPIPAPDGRIAYLHRGGRSFARVQ